jgi:phospholipase C
MGSRGTPVATLAGFPLVAAACAHSAGYPWIGEPVASSSASTSATPSPSQLDLAQERIQHVIIIVHENGSFDHCFGRYPVPTASPMQDGRPTVCARDPILGDMERGFDLNQDPRPPLILDPTS